jgi:hypothetical protein
VSDIVQVALVTGLSTAIPSLVVAWLNYQKISGVHKEMNGMKQALVDSAGREGRAEGKIEGHAQGVQDEKANPTK